MTHIFIADTHLGSMFCREELLEKFLLHSCDSNTTLVLLGDIFDFWKIEKITFDFREYLHPSAKIIFTPGNHDEELSVVESVRPCTDFSTAKLFSFMGGGSIVALHGHQFDKDYGDPYRGRLRFKNYLVYKLSEFLNINLRETFPLNYLQHKLFDARKFFHKAALFALGSGCPNIVLGHSHISGKIETDYPVNLFSLGGWVSDKVSPSALIIKENQYVLHEIKEGNLFPAENDFQVFRGPEGI